MLAWRPLVGLAAISAAALLLTAAPGWAHSNPPSLALVAGPAHAIAAQSSRAMVTTTPVVMPVFGLCLAAAALTLLPRHQRRLVSALLALLVTVIVFESSVHAVHHLGDPDGAARCAVASVTLHLSGAADPPQTSQPTFDAMTDHVIVAELLALGTRPLSPQRGRAPPSLAS